MSSLSNGSSPPALMPSSATLSLRSARRNHRGGAQIISDFKQPIQTCPSLRAARVHIAAPVERLAALVQLAQALQRRRHAGDLVAERMHEIGPAPLPPG